MELKYRNWNQVPISAYKKIKDASEIEDVTEREVALIAALCDASEEEVWSLSVNEVGSLAKQTNWVWDFSYDQNHKVKSLKIGGEIYEINYEVGKMSIAAYIDFQNYFKDRENNMGLLLTTFILPKGHKYGEGYDPAELAKVFEDNVSITSYNNIYHFFLKASLDSIKATAIYLALIAKETERLTGKALPKEIQEKMEKIAGLYGSL